MENKIFCHTTYIVNEDIIFEKGKYYEVVPEINDARSISSNDIIRNSETATYIKCERGFIIGIKNVNRFNKYFITIKELRKNKLEKLYEK